MNKGFYILSILAIMSLMVLVLFTKILELIIIRGSSMEPTLSDGDLVVVLRNPQNYRKGDICILVPPDNSRPLVIKRIDMISCDLNSGGLLYWMLGDNRDNSSDSRVYGWVNEEYLEGRVLKVWKKRRHK